VILGADINSDGLTKTKKEDRIKKNIGKILTTGDNMRDGPKLNKTNNKKTK
jgi:hypothetical protein